MAKFFTSDWHLNETRITPAFNPFFRPFESIDMQNYVIIENMNKYIRKEDTLIHLGDVAMDEEGVRMMDRIKCKNRILIIGNYDEDKLDLLGNYFDQIYPSAEIPLNLTPKEARTAELAYLNHYPVNASPTQFSIVGHIHGLWKVQPNMINVGVDAWNYEPLDMARILFVKEAIEKHYDYNVFPLTKPQQ